MTVTANDSYGDTATGYRGTVHFAPTDPRSVLPSDHTFTQADAGTQSFGATLDSLGVQTVRACDTVPSAIAGIEASVSPAEWAAQSSPAHSWIAGSQIQRDRETRGRRASA